MAVSRLRLPLRLCSVACLAMVLALGYILLRSPLLMEASAEAPIPRPVPAGNRDRHAHKADGAGSTKYFSEPGGSYNLVHYDSRYFQRELDAAERRAALRALIRSYLSLTSHYNIETWLAHGTLMGWWWGGRILPWDSDIDVQLSFETLDLLAREFNFTEFRYDLPPAHGRPASRTYLLDINPYYSEPGIGDGNNVIDARWIDTETGMFVDITALRREDDGSGAWACKDGHRYSGTDLWPLKESELEGVRALVPAQSTLLLRREYGDDSTKKEEYEGHHWDHHLRLWVQDVNK
ncbi:mannosylphosphate transferase [Metarhizium album ARSEF 1941]|uniref:Mannosylphosphate transferase n=1 Tax=Metarhizium album (strain ARSEF 1941) TaxID=1081103 RepID=A0A0B2WVV4_METAS|nr:mannosylphosphate transferase [Metarhizium album ARSEF 1941]KHO00257.1 mannosylphosphate transferase [Metarhizium album ARSEF 1941]